jgi:hypothetical protein
MPNKFVAPYLLLVLLLAACSSQPNSVKCRAFDVSGQCGSEVGWIALPAKTAEMQVLYQDERAIVYVNPKSIEAGQRLPRNDVEGNVDEVRRIIALAASGNIAVYDKLQKSWVTCVGVLEHLEQWQDEEGRPAGGVYSLGLILPDCTPLLGAGWAA